MIGYIKLHRQITENEFYFSERFTKSQAWIDLLLLANHKPNTIYIRGVEVMTQTGELCYSQLTLSKRWKWHRKTVHNFLLMLSKRQMIRNRITKITTVITILNWSKYQDSVQQNVQQSDNRMPTNKNDKECKRKESPAFPSLNLIVQLFSIINKKENELSYCYSVINKLLKYKTRDDLTPTQKCLMLMYIIKSNNGRTNEEKYIGILTNQFRELSYADFRKKVFEDSVNEVERQNFEKEIFKRKQLSNY